jgi:putative hemolysin
LPSSLIRARDPSPITFSYSTPEQPPLTRAVIRTLEFVGGRKKLEESYRRGRAAVLAGENFYETAIRLLALDVNYDKAMLAKVPTEGPVLFVANHPYGVLDGITFTWLAMQVRKDVKILANGVLCRLPETSEQLLPIDFAPSQQARETTLNSRIQAQAWLKQSHAVGIFPAGAVSTSYKPLEGPALDLPWAPFTAKLAMGAKATVVPVYFAGQNSRLFQMASHMSATLRLSLLFHETSKRIGTRLDVKIGEPIPYEDWIRWRERDAIVQEFRRRTFAMAPDQSVAREGRLTVS